MRILRKYIILGALAGTLPAIAQYDQKIEVEGKYVPEIIQMEKISLFPHPVKLTADKSELQYSTSGVAVDFAPTGVPQPATGWRDTHIFSRQRGYIDLGLGLWLNSTLSAGYRFIDDDKSLLGIRLQHNSTSLFKPKDMPHRMWRYDESIGVYGRHQFDEKGTLNASANYHIGNFNYYGLTGPEDFRQTLNDLGVRIGWNSPDTADNISYRVNAGMRYFGYRAAYMRDRFFNNASGEPQPTEFTKLPGSRESDIWLSGNLSIPTSGKSAIGLDLDAHALVYNNPAKNTELKTTNAYCAPDYGILSLTPYYRFSIHKLNLKLGAKVDLAFNSRNQFGKYSVFHIAPQVMADYNAGPASLYLHLLGGSRLHTMASQYELCYWASPIQGDNTPVYVPLDAKFGAGFGSFAGFNFGAEIAFRISRGEYTGGWYTEMLNNPSAALFYRRNMAGISVGIHAGYDAGRWLNIKAESHYQPQRGSSSYFNGYDMPRWIVAASAETNPWKSLKFKVGFEFRGKRSMQMLDYRWYRVDHQYASIKDYTSTIGLRNIANLSFSASYGISKNVSVWLQTDNLLNQQRDLYASLPAQGITAELGLSWIF